MTKISNQYSLTNVLFADTTNGRVGVNNTSPSYLIDAYSTGASNARINIAGTTNFVVSQYTNTGGTMYVGIDDSAGANFTGTAYGRFIYSSGAYPMSFIVNAVERMRITADGSIGINGLPNPDSGDTRLQINGGQYGTLNLRSTSVNASVRAHNPNGGLYVGTTSNHFAAIFTNDTERMRITSAGNVGIGTSSPNERLHVSGNISVVSSSGTRIGFNTSDQFSALGTSIPQYGIGYGWSSQPLGLSGYYGVAFFSTSEERMRISSGGKVLMGGTSDNGLGTLQVWHPTGGAGLLLRSGADLVLEPAVSPNNSSGFYNDYGSLQAFVGGSTGAYCNGTTWINGSDARLKKDINTISFNGLDAVSLLRPVSYKFINDEKEKVKIGFVAQEILEILPQVVDDTSGEYLGVDYGSISALLVKAIQEQTQIIKDLETRIVTLESK
jgi:hypothetical protein